MEADDRDQANASLLLNQKIDERIAETLMVLFAGNNTATASTLPLYPVSGEQVLMALLEHPMVKTRIYVQAQEVARMLILQAFKEQGERMAAAPTPYYTTPPTVYGHVYNADSLPKNRIF
jgi:hypothetical protein